MYNFRVTDLKYTYIDMCSYMYANLQNSVKFTSIWYPFDTQTMCFNANDVNPICFQTFEKFISNKIEILNFNNTFI